MFKSMIRQKIDLRTRINDFWFKKLNTKENDELISIFVKSVETAQRNMEKQNLKFKNKSKIANR